MCNQRTWNHHSSPDKPRSFRRIQGHLKGKSKIRVRSIKKHFLRRIIESSYFTQKLLMTWGCVRILTQVRSGKFKVAGRKSVKFGVNLFLWRNTRSSYMTQDCLSPKDVVMKWPNVILLHFGKFKVIGRKSEKNCVGFWTWVVQVHCHC